MTCRCGHDDAAGQPHRCHADRNDPQKRCRNDATMRLLCDPLGSSSLAGMQIKLTATPYWYCASHWAELAKETEHDRR